MSDDVVGVGDDVAAVDDDDETLLDRLRGTGVGVEDPNIVGDVGPTDVPPGHDPDGGLFADPPEPVDSIEPPDLMEDDLLQPPSI